MKTRSIAILNSCSVETKGFEADLSARNSRFLQNMSLGAGLLALSACTVPPAISTPAPAPHCRGAATAQCT